MPYYIAQSYMKQRLQQFKSHDAKRRIDDKKRRTRQINIKPITLDYEGTDLNLDMVADKLIGAERGEIQIAVKVKSFSNPSVTYDFHQAIGQYLHYRMGLQHLGIERTPYLALPDAIYINYLTQPFFRDSLSLHHVNLFTIDPIRQEVVQRSPNPLPR